MKNFYYKLISGYNYAMMNVIKVITGKKFLTICAIVIALCMCAYFSLGYLIGIFLTSDKIEEYFYKEVGLNLKLDSPKLKTMPDFSLTIKANNLNIFEKSMDKPMLNIEHPNLRIRIFPLIFKTVQISSLGANDFNFYTIRDEKGKFDFENYMNEKMQFPLKMKFKSSKIALKKANIVMIDNMHKKNTRIVSTKFYVNDFSEEKSLSFDTDFTLQIEDLQTKKNSITKVSAKSKLKFPIVKYLDSKDLYLNVQVDNFDAAPLLSYINEFSPLKFPYLSGSGNLSVRSLKNGSLNDFDINIFTKNIQCDFLYEEKLNTFSLKNPASITGGIKAAKNSLDISSLKFISKGINIGLDGTIDNYKAKNPNLNLTLNVLKSDLMSLVNLVPAGFVQYKTDLINELKAGKPYAIVNGKMQIQGGSAKPDVTGSLNFQDIYLFERPKNFPTAEAKCEFLGDKVKVSVNVPGPDLQFVKVNGVSELYGNKSGRYDIASSDAVDLTFTKKYLIPIQRTIGFKLGPLPYMDVSGIGKIHIVTNGTIDNATVDGKFVGRNVTASLEGLNAVLKNGQIELDFDGKVVNIVNTKAAIDDGMFYISGNADDYNNMDIKVDIKNINARSALQIAKTSEILKQQIGNIDFIKNANGKIDFTLLLKGKAESLEGLDFLNDIVPSGEIVFQNVSSELLHNIMLESLNGKLKYAKDYDFDITSKYKNAKISFKGVLTPSSRNLQDKNTSFRLKADSKVKNIYFSDLLSFLQEAEYFSNPGLKMAASNMLVKGINFSSDSNITIEGIIPADYKKTDLSKLSLNGAFTPLNSSVSKNIKFNSGSYRIKNSKLFIQDSNISLYGANMSVDGFVDEIFKKPKLTLKLKADTLSLSHLQNIVNYTKSPLVQSVISGFSDYKGTINADLNIRKNTPRGKVTFDSISAYNKKQNQSLVLKSGALRVNGSKLFVDALNLTYGTTPLYFNAVVDDFNSDKPKFNALFTTNINENAMDTIVNPYLTYPIKLKGEVRLKGRIRGGLNNYTVFYYLTLPQDSDITYMGANLGDEEYVREISSRIDFSRNTARINNARYLKYISSQNNKATPVTVVRADGNVVSKNNALTFDNLRINTPNPVTAKLFNVIFKKSILKQGLFTCDITLSGNVAKPLATGNINFQNINIPLYSTKITDMDFELTKNNINGVLKGKSFDSDVQIKTQIQNTSSFPIVLNSLDISSKNLSLSQVFDGFAQIPRVSSDIVPGQPIVFKPQDLIIKEGTAQAQDVELYNIKAANLKAKFSNPTGMVFNIDDMVFDIADGKIESKGSFDFSDSRFKLNSTVVNCDSNSLTKSFLNLDNQIYGRGNANISLKGKIPQNAQELKNIEGKVNFSVDNGKMPKLGSLEYLLRAGNLLKSGVLGLTINNLIEVLTPYKTGEFSAIKGSFNIKDAKISSLEIYSKGKNLSLFLYGNYDVMNDNADIEVLGRLSKNVSNLLGAVGNASLNTLLSAVTGNKIKEGTKTQIINNVNKIPLIELSADEYRLFIVKVSGSLNSEDYVKSFNWLN